MVNKTKFMGSCFAIWHIHKIPTLIISQVNIRLILLKIFIGKLIINFAFETMIQPEFFPSLLCFPSCLQHWQCFPKYHIEVYCLQQLLQLLDPLMHGWLLRDEENVTPYWIYVLHIILKLDLKIWNLCFKQSY